MLNLQTIQKVASAVEAGRLAALAGRTDNPFSDDDFEPHIAEDARAEAAELHKAAESVPA